MSESKVAIVTGGAQGIGAAICEALLKKGYKVCVIDIQKRKGEMFVNEQQKIYGIQNVKFFLGDVSKEDDFKGLFEFTLKEFKEIDLVVNNAGVFNEFNERLTVDVNLMGTIIGCRLALKYMGKSKGGKGGAVINVSSIAGLFPFFDFPVYAATKYAIVGLTRSYGHSYHFEKDGVLFAALCPLGTDTQLRRESFINCNVIGPNMFDNEEDMAPEYVAQGVLKLLEDRINGSILLIAKRYGYEYVKFPEKIENIISK